MHFVQLKQGEQTFKRCLDAINVIGMSESWMTRYNQEAEAKNSLPTMSVLAPYWEYDIAKTDITWEYEKTFAQAASYIYKKYDGQKLEILEDRSGRSEVISSIGIPENILEKLVGLDSVRLNEALDVYVKGKVIDSSDVELRLSDYQR